MTLEAFKKIVLLLKKDLERESKLYKLGIDVFNFNDELQQVISILLKSHYSKDGEDLFSWWMYEDVDKMLYDNDGNIVNDLTKCEDLWKYLEDMRKSADFVEYVPEKRRKISQKKLEKTFSKMFNS